MAGNSDPYLAVASAVSTDSPGASIAGIESFPGTPPVSPTAPSICPGARNGIVNGLGPALPPLPIAPNPIASDCATVND